MITQKLFLIAGFLGCITANAQSSDVISNGENVRVMEPGQQTPEANLRHQQLCQAIGGTDSTNKVTISATANTQDVVSCDMSLNPNPKAGIVPINSDGSLGKFIPNDDSPQQLENIPPGLISLVAPSGNVQYQQNFYAVGKAQYFNNINPNLLLHTLSTMSIPLDKCATSLQQDFPFNSGNIVSPAITCTAWTLGSVPSQMQGCTSPAGSGNPPECLTAVGSIYTTKP